MILPLVAILNLISQNRQLSADNKTGAGTQQHDAKVYKAFYSGQQQIYKRQAPRRSSINLPLGAFRLASPVD